MNHRRARLQVRDGKVHFAEVLFYAVAERSAGVIKINEEEAQRELEKTWARWRACCGMGNQ